MIENKLGKRWNAKYNSPDERCISSNHNGPCPYLKVNGTRYCVRHGANSGVQARTAETQRNYRLTEWKERVGELADNNNLKSLREEVGILRMILEQMLNQCKDSMDILLYSSKMSDLVMKIDKLVISTDKLENRMGLLLSKDSVLHLAAVFVTIINNHVTDPNVIDIISNEMMEATEEIGNPILEGA